LGFIYPVTIRAKLFLWQFWQKHVDWEAPLEADLSTEWHTIAANITNATTLPFSCKYTASIPPAKNASTNLHVFADASLKAYGAVTYLQQDEQPALLVMSKSRAVHSSRSHGQSWN